MRAATLFAAGALALASAAPALAGPGDIAVSNGEVRATLGGSSNSAAYMVITNTGSKPDRLVSVACACATQAVVHISQMMGGMMMMRPAGPVAIPAHGRVRFSPGGLHVMLTGLKSKLIDGGRQAMVLRFAHAGPITASFRIRARIVGEASAPMRGDMDSMPGMSH